MRKSCSRRSREQLYLLEPIVNLLLIVPVTVKRFDDYQETFEMLTPITPDLVLEYEFLVLLKGNVRSVFAECTKDF